MKKYTFTHKTTMCPEDIEKAKQEARECRERAMQFEKDVMLNRR